MEGSILIDVHQGEIGSVWVGGVGGWVGGWVGA